MDGNQVLADGQRIQYRGLLQGGRVSGISGFLTTVSGDPDLYIWKPRNAFWPDPLHPNDTVLPGQTEYLSNQFVPEDGRYLMEVQAVGASEYQLTVSGGDQTMAAAASAPLAKQRPAHPLTVSDPLSAGQVGPVDALQPKIYLPLMFRNN